MKRNTKATYQAFREQVEKAFKERGIAGTPDKHINGCTSFTVETSAGAYECLLHANLGDDPRPLNFLTVTGRFANVALARTKTDCNPHNGKWNFEGVGYVATPEEARQIADRIVHRITTL